MILRRPLSVHWKNDINVAEWLLIVCSSSTLCGVSIRPPERSVPAISPLYKYFHNDELLHQPWTQAVSKAGDKEAFLCFQHEIAVA